MVRAVKCNFVVVVVDDELKHLQAGKSKYKRKTDVIIFFYMLNFSQLIHIQSQNVFYTYCFVSLA